MSAVIGGSLLEPYISESTVAIGLPLITKLATQVFIKNSPQANANHVVAHAARQALRDSGQKGTRL